MMFELQTLSLSTRVIVIVIVQQPTMVATIETYDRRLALELD